MDDALCDYLPKEVSEPLKLSTEMYIILISVIAFLGGVVGFLLRKRFSEARIVSSKEVAKGLIEEAEKKAEILKKEAVLQAKDKFYQEKAEFEKETMEKRQELQNLERRLVQRESHLDKKIELLDTKETDITRREKTVDPAGEDESRAGEKGDCHPRKAAYSIGEHCKNVFRRGKALVDGVNGE